MRAQQKTYFLSDAFARLLHVLRNARSSSRGVTLVLGAGCSLSSSSDPLTTESIVRGWVEEIVGKDQASSWPMDRVWVEFVRQWDNVGHADRVRYLAERLSPANPGHGYGCLASLVSAKYIKRIVTTNFDLLLDHALNGIPSKFRIGTNGLVERGDGSPIVEVLKVHGDISGNTEAGAGPLRFSPHELDNLPIELANLVREMTSEPTIVIGYSGADRGFMRSLASISDHTAFWVVPDRFGLHSSYTGQEVLSWLTKRRAVENIIDGQRLGFFDLFMEELAAALIEGKDVRVRDYTALPTYWLDTPVSHSLGANYHLKRVASIFLELLEWAVQGRRWDSSIPPFAVTPHGLAGAAALLFRELPLGSIFDGIPRNEVDALLLLVAIEFRVCTAGYGILAKDLLAAIRNGYQSRYETYDPHESFWNALDFLVSEVAPPLPPDRLEMRLNCQRRLVLIVHSTPLVQLRSLLEVVDVLRVIHAPLASGPITHVPTACLYRSFQEKVSDMHVRDGKLRLRINGLTESAFRSLCECLLEALPQATISQEGRTLESRFVLVELIPGDQDPTSGTAQPSNLFELLEHRSRHTCDTFLAKASPLMLPIAHTILRAHDEEIERFLLGSKPAAILAGPSGSGKSVSIANLLRKERQQLRTMVVVVEGSAVGSADLMATFFPELPTTDQSAVSLAARMAVAVTSRQCNLLLIVDGINEASADFAVVEQYWKALLALIIRLGQMEGCPVKLLVTCREGTLAALAKSAPPPASLFFSPKIIDDYAPPSIIVPPLKLAEVEAIVKANLGSAAMGIISEFQSNSYLLSFYSRPFWLAVAANEIAAGSGAVALRNPRSMVGKVCDDLFARALPNREDSCAFDELLDTGFAETVIRPADKARNFGFAAKRVFGWERRERYDHLLRNLVDVGIVLTSSSNVLTDFRFSHDLIEEHFLGKFLLRRFEEGEAEDFLHLCTPGQYFGNGLQALLSVLDDLDDASTNRRARLLAVIEKLRAYAGKRADLAEILVRSFEDRSDIEADLVSLSHGSTLTAFLVAGMNSVLEKGGVAIPDRLSSAMSIVLSKLGADAQQRAEVELVQSLCAYRHDRFADALRLADSASDLLTVTKGADYGMIDRICQQKGTLLSKTGQKAAAIKLLKEVYQRRKSQGCFREAFENGLELGAVYRDASAFLESLEVYKEIGEWKADVSPFMKCRLLLQMGTVKKNLLQQVTETARYDNCVLNDEQQQSAKDLYHEAMSAIQDAEKWAEDNDSMQLLLTCMSERAECMLVMACLEPRLVPLCEETLAAFSALLDRHPMVARRVEYHREVARLEEIKSEIECSDAAKQQHRMNIFDELQAGRCIAMGNGLAYQVADCDCQLARFSLRALSATGSSVYFHRGIQSIDAVIAYYEANEFEGRHYLENAQRTREQLRQLAIDRSILRQPATKPEGDGKRAPKGRA